MNSSKPSRWERDAAAADDRSKRSNRGAGMAQLVERELVAQGLAAPSPAADAIDLARFGGFAKFDELHENNKKLMQQPSANVATPSPVPALLRLLRLRPQSSGALSRS